MSFEDLRSGAVIRYPYLWSWQAGKGETAGRKTRPTVVGVRVRAGGMDRIVLFPITSQQPEPTKFAAEIPAREKRIAGLDVKKRLWIVLDEYNADVVGESYYIEPVRPLGYFSAAFFLPLVKEFIKRRAQARVVSRRN